MTIITVTNKTLIFSINVKTIGKRVLQFLASLIIVVFIQSQYSEIGFAQAFSQEMAGDTIADTASYYFEEVDISVLDTGMTTLGGIMLGVGTTYIDSLNRERESKKWFGQQWFSKLPISKYVENEDAIYKAAKELHVSMSVISAMMFIESMWNEKICNRWGYCGVFQINKSGFNYLRKVYRFKPSFSDYKKMSMAEQLEIATIYWKHTIYEVNYSKYKPLFDKKAHSRTEKGLSVINDFNSITFFMFLQVYPKALKQKQLGRNAPIPWGFLARKRNGGAKTFAGFHKTIIHKNLIKVTKNYKKYWGLAK